VETFVLVIVALLLIFLVGWVALIEYRYQKLAGSFRLLMTGRGGADLEATLIDFVSRIDRIEKGAEQSSRRIGLMEAKSPYGLQHLGVVRFNPFQDKGGDQSFVVAILDDHADGTVLTSIASRVDTRIYAKPVVGGQSTYNLTGEERQAIARAMKPRA
jgi:hypothetical protein